MASEPNGFGDGSANPYAPPTSIRKHDTAEIVVEGVSVPFVISEILRVTGATYKRWLGLGLGAIALCAGVALVFEVVVPNVLPFVMPDLEPETQAVVEVSTDIVFMLVETWLGLGLVKLMLNLVRGGKRARFADVFSGGRYLFRGVGVAILVILGALSILSLTVLAGELAGMLSNDLGTAMKTFRVFLPLTGIACLVFLVRMSQSVYVLVDRDCDLLQAMMVSSRMTKGRALRVMGIYLVLGLVNLGGFLLVCVGYLVFGRVSLGIFLLACLGILFTIPYMWIGLAVTYVALAGETSADQGAIDKWPDAASMT